MSPLTSSGYVTQVVTLGETMALMKAETPGPLAHVSSLSLGVGGAESNFAVALRRLGTSVTWVGRLGADSLGDLVQRELAAEGIVTLAIRDADAPTGLMIKERRTPDALRVWYYRTGSAGSRLSWADVPPELIAGAELLHVTGITLGISDSAREAVHQAVECARRAGVLVSFDLNYRSALWPPAEAARDFASIIAKADLVFAGESEAAMVVGAAEDPLTLAHRIAELGPTQSVIKLGADGCVAVVDGHEYRRPAVRINAVDSVGAGDAFVAGYVSELVAGANTSARLRTAVRAGAFACLVPGDWEGMPRRQELALLDATEPVTR